MSSVSSKSLLYFALGIGLIISVLIADQFGCIPAVLPRRVNQLEQRISAIENKVNMMYESFIEMKQITEMDVNTAFQRQDIINQHLDTAIQQLNATLNTVLPPIINTIWPQ